MFYSINRSQNKNVIASLTLLKAGLWEKDVRLLPSDIVDYAEVFRIAEEQAVVGLITAGIEHVTDAKVPQVIILQFVGQALQIEQRNASMNKFIEWLIKKLQEAGINALLVKGQGIAQCYERPLWRTCGDVDLFLDESNYNKAVCILTPLASYLDKEDVKRKHFALSIDSWLVELHGTLRSEVGRRIDNVIDVVQRDTFINQKTRIWKCGGTDVLLPDPDNDIIFVFTHILQHFFLEGIGLRQICDWCRLLWTYRDDIDTNLLESRLEAMNVMKEWKSLAALAVYDLDMPKEAIPFFSSLPKWKRNADQLKHIIFETGNFGYNRDTSYHKSYSPMVCKMITFYDMTSLALRRARLFPMCSMRVWLKLVMKRMKSVFV